MNVTMLSAPARLPRRTRVRPKNEPAPARGTPGPATNKRLEANPLFVRGSNYDEFQLTGRNVDFAAGQFNLDPAFVAMVKSRDTEALRFSVVYHSDDQSNLVVDAYRAAAPAAAGSVFSAYDVKNADFNPQGAYRNELITPLGDGKFFGTVLASKRLAVPETADPSLTKWLTDNGFAAAESIPVSQMELPASFKGAFGLPETLNVQMYDFEKKSFSEKFKVFYSLFQESSEYRALKIGDIAEEVGAAMLLGVITPELWKQGTAYGIASTISSIGNIGSPAVGILGESLLGSVVDNAVNSDRPVDNLKKIGMYTATARAAGVGTAFAMHPAIVTAIGGANPGMAFVGLYASNAVLGALTGVVSGKANMAIHDQLINKATGQNSEFSKNFYQILGVEASISRALYLGSYSATVAAVSAFPAYSLPIAGAGALLWGGSSFIWPAYREKPEVKTTVAGTAYVRQGDRYRFDSGWEVEFGGGKGKIVRENDHSFSVSIDSGDLTIRNDESVSMTHKRRIQDYLPTALKPKMLGEKEQWRLSDGHDLCVVSRYGNAGYSVEQLSSNELKVALKNP